MSTQKTFICLANSAKKGGRCIAGKEVTYDRERNQYYIVGTWFRPINKDEPQLDSKYVNINIGTIVQCMVDEATPNNIQPENCTIVENSELLALCSISSADFSHFLDSPTELWAPGFHSSLGMNDRVPAFNFTHNTQSLYFIEIGPHQICKMQYGSTDANPKSKIKFSYENTKYCLPLTVFSSHWNSLNINECVEIKSSAYITISLGQPFTDEYCYKLVAGYVLK